jgi:hypothetical protein
MRAAGFVLAVSLTCGCVSANPSPGALPYRDVATTEDGSVIRTTSDYAIKGSLNLPLDEAYAAMLLAYSHLGIEATASDSGSHVVGNTSVTVERQFLKENLSRYFECGRDAGLGTPRADHYRITFSVFSTLRASGTSATNVETLVTARGVDPGGNASDVYCATTGRLEAQLLRAAHS